jgi:hypothetical protein
MAVDPEVRSYCDDDLPVGRKCRLVPRDDGRLFPGRGRNMRQPSNVYRLLYYVSLVSDLCYW